MDTILFDLDGTLLPLNEDVFINVYISGLVNDIVSAGYPEKLFLKALWTGIEAMRNNNGDATNEKTFWSTFFKYFPDQDDIESIFMNYYNNGYKKTKQSTTLSPYSALIVNTLKEKGYRIILATNPLFPSVATYQRIEWAGLSPNDFSLVTTIENANYCKPNLKYYEQILNNIGVVPEHCLMIGNDVQEDMVARKLGIDVFLLEENIINQGVEDIGDIKRGRFPELLEYIQNLPTIKI